MGGALPQLLEYQPEIRRPNQDQSWPQKSERKSTPAIKHEKATKTALGTKGADRPKQTQAAKVLDAPIGFTVDLLGLSHAVL